MREVLIATSKFNKKLLIDNYGFKFILNPFGRTLSETELLELSNDNIVGILAGTESYTENVLYNFPNLKVISRCGSGTDNLRKDLLDNLDIKLFTTPDSPVKAVAELTVGLIFSILRNIPKHDKDIKNGIWNKFNGNLLYGKSVGIVGHGKIGGYLEKILNSFGCIVYYYDPLSISKKNFLPFESLIQNSDIISIHVPSNESTKSLFTEENFFKNLKEGCIVINTSRGDLIDTQLLYTYLVKHKISGAALDVYDNEPYRGSLIELDNVVLTPHIGSYTYESRSEMEILSLQNLMDNL